MSLIAPVAGEKKVLAASWGRALVEQPFTYPDGRVEIYSLWSWMKGSAAIIFPVTEDGFVVAIRQFRHGANGFILELPGGLPKGEQTPKETVQMELEEETGYQAKDVIQLGVSTWIDSPSHDVKVSFFLGVGCKKVSDVVLDENEVIETMLVPLAEWYQMIADGRICDAKVIAHSLLALPHVATIHFNK